MIVETPTGAILYVDGVGFLTTVHDTDAHDPEGCDVYAWSILTADAKQLATSRDHGQDVIRTGVQGGEPREVLATLLSFLDADADAYRRHMGASQPEDGYSFGEPVAEWAYGVADELAMAGIELEEGGDTDE